MGRTSAGAVVALIVFTVGITRFFDKDGEDRDPNANLPVLLDERAPLEGDLIEWISEGEEVDLKDYLEHGVLSVVEFTADW